MSNKRCKKILIGTALGVFIGCLIGLLAMMNVMSMKTSDTPAYSEEGVQNSSNYNVITLQGNSKMYWSSKDEICADMIPTLKVGQVLDLSNFDDVELESLNWNVAAIENTNGFFASANRIKAITPGSAKIKVINEGFLNDGFGYITVTVIP